MPAHPQTKTKNNGSEEVFDALRIWEYQTQILLEKSFPLRTGIQDQSREVQLLVSLYIYVFSLSKPKQMTLFSALNIGGHSDSRTRGKVCSLSASWL